MATLGIDRARANAKNETKPTCLRRRFAIPDGGERGQCSVSCCPDVKTQRLTAMFGNLGKSSCEAQRRREPQTEFRNHTGCPVKLPEQFRPQFSSASMPA